MKPLEALHCVFAVCDNLEKQGEKYQGQTKGAVREQIATNTSNNNYFVSK